MNSKRMSSSPLRIYEAARYAILGLVLFTVVNILFYFLNSDSYYVSSVFTAYAATVLLAYEGLLVAGLVVAAVVLAPFVVAFFLSKKKSLWLIIALVLVALDTAVLAFFCIDDMDFFIGSILDFLAHAAVIVLLALAIKNSKAALADPIPAEEQAAADPAIPQPAAQAAAQDTFVDVPGVVSIMENGRNKTMPGEGVARFNENELVIGAKNFGMQMLVGSLLASTKEQLRVPYTEITRAYYAHKNERSVKLDLLDGRTAFIQVGNDHRERLAALLNAHGLAIEPFVQE